MDNRQTYDLRKIDRSQFDFGEIYTKNRQDFVFSNNMGPLPERRSTISSMIPCGSYQNNRMRNLSGGSSGSTASGSSSGSSTQLDNQYSEKLLSFALPDALFNFSSSGSNGSDSSGQLDNQYYEKPITCSVFSIISNNSAVPATRGNTTSHRKLDRSLSDADSDRNGSHKSVNSSRYKTELCRPFEESGSCKYGDKCQFAHGYHELRNLTRHPKYKTERCRTFHTVGFCPYGPRCHFIHEEESKPADSSPKLVRAGSLTSSSGSSSPSLSPAGSDDFRMFTYHPELATQTNSFLGGLTADIHDGSSFDLRTLEKCFSSMKLTCGSINDNSIFNNNQKPKHIGTEERDIFSEITMFNSEDVDNTHSLSSCAVQSFKLDNFPFMNNRTPAHLQSYGNGF